jgi:hypothetical protein
LNSFRRFWQYAEEHPTLVLGTIGSVGAVLLFFWDNLRLFFWIILVCAAVAVLGLLVRGATIDPLVVHPLEWAWFFNVGENNQHGGSWQACREHGFLSAGGGPKWQKDVKALSVGDPVYAYVSAKGYVGFGKVIEAAVPIKNFTIGAGKKSLLSSSILPEDLRKQLESASDAPDYSDYVVRIAWHKTYSKDHAIKGIYASPQTVCKFTNRKVLESLARKFSKE